jgi:hypothetical protein
LEIYFEIVFAPEGMKRLVLIQLYAEKKVNLNP